MDCNPPGSSVYGFSKQEYWSGLPCPPPGDLPSPGIKPVSAVSPALQADYWWATREAHLAYYRHSIYLSNLGISEHFIVLEVCFCSKFLIYQIRDWNCKKLPDAWEKPLLASGSAAWDSSSPTQSVFSDMNLFQSVRILFVNQRFSLTAKHHHLCWHTSEPGLLFLLWLAHCGTFLLWLWMHVLPQDSPAASPPGNCPWLPRLVWVPFFRPCHTWTQLCRSTQVQ